MTDKRLTNDEQVYIQQGKIAIDICTVVNNSPALREMLGLTPGDNIMPRLRDWLESRAAEAHRAP